MSRSPLRARSRRLQQRSLGSLVAAFALLLLLLVAARQVDALSAFLLGPEVRGATGPPGEAVVTVDPTAFSGPLSREVTVTTVGDLLMHVPINWAAETPDGDHDYSPMFDPVRDDLSRADLTIANLETTLGGPARGYTGFPMFSSPDSLLDGIMANGVDAIITANNHSLDSFGPGLIRTLRAARERGLTAIGTRAGPDEPAHAMFVRNGIRIAVLAYTYGTNGIPIPEPWMVTLIDEERMAAQIATAKEDEPDLILVAMHWGSEYVRHHSAEQARVGRFLHEQGVHGILGTHPHVVQPIEILSSELADGSLHETAVIYSTGNFISNQRQRYRDGGIMAHVTYTLELDADGQSRMLLERVEHTPVWVHRYPDPGRNLDDFRVLPAEPGRGEDSPHMSEAHLQVKHQSYQDTLEILGPSPVYVRDAGS